MTRDAKTGRRAKMRSCDPRDFVVTAEDVRKFFDAYPKTKDGARALLHRLGVRFKSNGAFSHVVSL